ncbi:MAG TPA: cytochrome c [Candidatus Acidoferrales bacterium]|nr:cytochrome c [Candidatus Acidoferrales bacterium]
MKRWTVIAVIAIVVIVAGAWTAFATFNLSALPEPSAAETYFATKGKHMLVHRAAAIAGAPADAKAAAEEGDKYFGVDCSMCHGATGRKPTDNGRWMYPRAIDLGSAETQSYSDRELFWIVKNGIRLSGMPAFGKMETDEHIWELVEYIRTMPGKPKGK